MHHMTVGSQPLLWPRTRGQEGPAASMTRPSEDRPRACRRAGCLRRVEGTEAFLASLNLGRQQEPPERTPRGPRGCSQRKARACVPGPLGQSCGASGAASSLTARPRRSRPGPQELARKECSIDRSPARNERENAIVKNEQRLKDLQKENARLSVCVYWSPRMKRERKSIEEIMA